MPTDSTTPRKPIRAWATPMAYEPLLDTPFHPQTDLPLSQHELTEAARQLAEAMDVRSSLIAQAERLTPDRFRPSRLPPTPPKRLRLA